jgi:thioredoxin-related protein
MRTGISLLISAFLLSFLMANCRRTTEAKKENWVEFKNIYHADADARQDIANAIRLAHQANKRVLLIFGANWCPWCQALHHLFDENSEIREFLSQNYEVVLVDLGKRDRNMEIDELYGKPNKLGLPAIVVLDKDGKQIHTQETGSLEYAKEHPQKGHDPTKVMQFLKGWAPLRS